jgi:transmembrane sensor
MSGANSSPLAAIRDGRAIEERAAAFVIAHRDRAEWSAQDQSDLESWLAESPFHRAAFLRLDAAWSRADRVRALRPPSPQNARGIRANAVRAAIGLALLAGLGAAWLLWPMPVTTYATRVGGHETLHLADGSEVDLNTDTVLRAAITQGRRVVWLDHGEAYFHVAHDPSHPFVVKAGERSVEVLGTEFSMRRDADDLRVSLLEGHVRFTAKDEGAHTPIDLVAGDVVAATRNTLTLMHEPKRLLDTSMSWRRGVLVFDHTPLVEAARELNRYNVEKIIIGDDETAKTTIGGTFEATNVAGFARVAHAVLGLRVEIRAGETVISR